MILVEIAVETRAAAQAAAAGGAGRLELCADLHAAGGLTPSEALTKDVLGDVDIPIFPMIRSRPGDFVYSRAEVDDMCRTIERMRSIGVHGFVSGALTAANGVDRAATASLVAAADGMPFTFHRAFDRIKDQSAGLEQLIELGVTRVLTSGGAASALEGSTQLRALVEQSAGRIMILAGAGVRESNVRQIVSLTGVSEVHTKLMNDAAEQLTVERVRQFRTAMLPEG